MSISDLIIGCITGAVSGLIFSRIVNALIDYRNYKKAKKMLSDGMEELEKYKLMVEEHIKK